MKNLLLTFVVALMPLGVFAQFGVVAPLHVSGNQLNDQYGNKVVLHGVMDTPNPYFNKNRWGYACNDGTVQSCINYFDKIFTAITNTRSGAYCNIFRLHLDPCWTNDPAKQSSGSDTGEANISRFSSSRLQKYLNSLYWPIAKKAIGHGLYVVVRPPGVCPKDLRVGDAYQQYLKTVWDIVSSNADIKNNSGIVSLELANEPVHIYNAYGQTSATAMRDYFQPVVDIIRRNGFKGIIWIPGTGYQSQYQDYAKNPVNDNNYGYAVHVYPGWYGASDKSYDHNMFIKNFQNQVPVVTSKPILVSEIDWSPEKPGSGKYNEFGQWVASNLGTWGTASTSKWGNAWKAVHDYFGNISMTLSATECYLDIDAYMNSGKVTPNFGGTTEASAGACFNWYAQWAKVNYAHASDNTPQPVPSYSLIPSLDTYANNVMPSDWKVVDNGSTCTAGTKASGPRIMKFANGGDFTTGFYLRTIRSDRDGYGEYGSISGHKLSLTSGSYVVSLNTVAWTGSPYVKCEVLNSNGNVVASKVARCSTSVNKDTNTKISNSTLVSFSFNCSANGDYCLRISPVADNAGNKGEWNEIIVGNISLKKNASTRAADSSAANITEELDVNSEEDHGAWYNIQGMRLNAKPAQSGIYIHNGKKYVMK